MAVSRTCLEITGFRLFFESDRSGIISVLRRRYGPFLVRGGGLYRFECSQGPARQSPFKPSVKWEGRTLKMARGDFRAELDTRSGSGRLTAAPNEQCLDAFLRTLLSSLLLDSGGLMVHSAGLLKGGRAWLLPGKSGAGKSTLSKLAAAAGAEVISDEIGLLRFEGGRWRAYGSPFWGEMRSGGRRGSWPVGGVLLPKKARRHGVSACGRTEAFRMLMRCTVNFSLEGSAAAAALAAVNGLLGKVPARRLEFSKKDAGFLRFLK